MNTKLTLLILMLIGFTLNGFAQGFGLNVNYNAAKLKVIYDGKVQPEEDFEHYNSLPGFGLALNYDIELSENLFGETGLSYQLKGIKEVVEDEGNNGSDLVLQTKINYLQIPLHLKYNFEIGDETYIFGFGGFDIAFALSGTYSNGDDSIDIKFGSSESDHYTSSDFGFTLGTGILYNNLEFRLGFSNGLSDIDPDKDDEAYNRVFFIGVGYRFNN